MKIYSLVNRKGGAGKTTLAANFGVLAAKKGKASVVLFDMDGQGSLANWAQERKERGIDWPQVATTTPAKLEADLEKCADAGVDTVIIDTKGDMDRAARLVVQHSHLCIIPLSPSPLDINASEESVQTVKQYGGNAALLLTRVDKRSKLHEDAAELLEDSELPLCKTVIGSRQDLVVPIAYGSTAVEESKGRTSDKEIRAAWNWLKKQAN